MSREKERTLITGTLHTIQLAFGKMTETLPPLYAALLLHHTGTRVQHRQYK